LFQSSISNDSRVLNLFHYTLTQTSLAYYLVRLIAPPALEVLVGVRWSAPRRLAWLTVPASPVLVVLIAVTGVADRISSYSEEREDVLRVESASTARIHLSSDHGTWLAGVGRVERRILEGVADELIARNAVVDLRHKVLAGTVFEHVLTARITTCLGTVGVLSQGSGVELWLTGEDCGGRSYCCDGEERQEAHDGLVLCRDWVEL
jgi:hypothetical protein